MATATKKCRVCGKEYEACHTVRHIAGVFRWQEVACSPECGGIYLAQIEESRRVNQVKNAEVTDIQPVEASVVCTEELIDEDTVDECELDDELDEYFDDAE